MPSKTALLQDSRLKVHKGEKGRLITAQDNPRLLKEDDPMIEFERCLGGHEKAKECLKIFEEMNDGDQNQKIMADGIILDLIRLHKVSKRTLALVLKIGSGRIKRIRDGKSKVTDHVHLNGNQVHNKKFEIIREKPLRNIILYGLGD